ncbi:hypothetical protein GCM10025876_16970 [Demequina litorisediminis]|uniref:Uncharacterized protein n=1 Tax=Demequina litorisediminis TaxID=1849022 RepID=A0ABQ6IFG2_9MICO|nr:hypothetical protein GCM10025876_16970 [Demequina litorisediminis]
MPRPRGQWSLARSLGNIPEPGVPSGGEDDFTVLRHEGTPRDFAAEGIEVKDHLAIGEGLKAIDMERGAKVSGARFYFLTGIGARLEPRDPQCRDEPGLRARLLADDHAHAGASRDDGRHGLPRQARGGDLLPRAR